MVELVAVLLTALAVGLFATGFFCGRSPLPTKRPAPPPAKRAAPPLAKPPAPPANPIAFELVEPYALYHSSSRCLKRLAMNEQRLIDEALACACLICKRGPDERCRIGANHAGLDLFAPHGVLHGARYLQAASHAIPAGVAFDRIRPRRGLCGVPGCRVRHPHSHVEDLVKRLRETH